MSSSDPKQDGKANRRSKPFAPAIKRHIAERKKSAAALRESNEQLETLWNGMAEGTALHEMVRDAAGRAVNYRIVKVNPQYQDIIGLRAEEVIGKLATEVYGAPVAPYLEEYSAVVRSGKPSAMEVYFAPLGKHFYISIAPWGKDGFATIFTDITERRKMARELEESKALIEAVVENVPLMIFLKEASDLRFVLFNRAGEDLLGYDRTDLLGKNDLDLFPPEQAAHFMAKDQEVLEGKARILDIPEEPILTAKKGQRLLHTQKVCIHGADGAKKYLLGISEDITERKKVEALLYEREEKYHNLFNNAGVGMFRTSLDGAKIMEFNSHYLGMLGYTLEEVADKPSESLWVDPSARAAMIERLKAEGRIENLECQLYHKNGQVLTCLTSLRLYREQGVLEGSIIDITERKKTEAALANLHKLESLGILAGGIAHDFNNILTGIMGSISLLQSHVAKNDEAKEIIREAQDACGTAKNLAHQLLTFAKGGSPIIKAQDLRPLLKQAAGFATRGSNAHCVFDFGEDPLAVKVDKEQVSQVIQNLVINATQAMPEGGDITIESHIVTLGEKEIPPLAAGRYVRVTVRDQGEGIAAAHLPKIFDPYFSTKAQGRGLGLSVCYSIMAKHGGLISVDSKPGEGAVFTLLFPAADAADIPAELEPAAITTGSGRVLVMDDDAQVSRVLTRMLKNLGYQPDAVADGQAACEAYKKAMSSDRPYAAVILDLTVPGGMGGKEAMVKLKAIDPQAKAIVSSGYSEDPLISEYAAHGFSGVLAKPYVVNEVSDALRRIIGSKTG